MKISLLLSSLFLSLAEGIIHSWVSPNTDGFTDPSCGNMRGAYAEVVDQAAQSILPTALYNLLTGVHALHNAANGNGTQARYLEEEGEQHHQQRFLVDCSICESNPPSSIEACCIQITYQHCGVCIEFWGGRRRARELDATTTPLELQLVGQLPALNAEIKAKLDNVCQLEATQNTGATPPSPNCWSCDNTGTWNGTVHAVSVLDGY